MVGLVLCQAGVDVGVEEIGAIVGQIQWLKAWMGEMGWIDLYPDMITFVAMVNGVSDVLATKYLIKLR